AAQQRDTVRCEIAKLRPNGTYDDRVARFLLGPEFLDPSGLRVKFAVRTWPANSSDPTRIVTCEIPNTPAALHRFQSMFGVDDGAHTSLDIVAQSGRSMMLGPLSGEPLASSRVTDSTAHVFDDSNCIIADGCTSCPDGAISCDPGSGEWEGPAPSDPDVPSYSV